MFVAAAAACVLAVVAWHSRFGKDPQSLPGSSQPAIHDIRRPSFDSASIPAWRDEHRLLDEEKLPAFTWPLDDTTAIHALSPIPSDLLD
jgi:hypothetical protein